MTNRLCRFCNAHLDVLFVDLGMSPPSNSFLTEAQVLTMERFYPLRVYVCAECFLVQLEEFESPSEIFSDYVYFSSYSTSWLRHSRMYVDRIVQELSLKSNSLVVELASNDGYLLQYFQEYGVPVLGVEPAANVALEAIKKGIPTEVAFFGAATARELRDRTGAADLIVANNVLAHVPDINDFVAGVRILLSDEGTATFEFPHLLQLIRYNQFDTIYHEHFSYLSLLAVLRIFKAHDLKVVHVEELTTHGGSLRVWAKLETARQPPDESVTVMMRLEYAADLAKLETYTAFAARAEATKRHLLKFLIEVRESGKHIAAYGAAAKGTTLLNYCGIRTDFIDYVVDRNPHKQGKYLPGCHVPVYNTERISETRPDYLLILPWNLRAEIEDQMSEIRSWGGQFVVPIPTVEVF